MAFFALIAIIDIRYRVIPNLLTYSGIAVALFANVVIAQRPPLPILLGMVFAFGIFYLVARLRPDELGGGDVKLAALLGAIFGFPLILWVLIVSVVTSGAAIFYLLSSGGRTLKDTIPYAPFLCLGAVTVILCNSLFGV
ncbi:MAG: prepilin peptidase [Chloroflexi bacterium]|nr:prepilin peptidase [Chloroflexota bacterium]